MAEAVYYKEGETYKYTADAAVTGGEVRQAGDGRCGVAPIDVANAADGDLQFEGVYTVAKTANIVFLDGSRVYWDHSANTATFKSVSDRDFYMGVAVGDTAGSATTVKVNLNVLPHYKMDLARDPYISVLVGTAALNGYGYPYREGGSLRFNITATSEAQKVDALGIEGVALGSNMIVEGAFRIGAAGSGGASDYSIGLANASHASNADTITDSIFIHLDGASTTINAECDDGTNETAATTTATTFTAGTALANRVEFWIDCRDPSSVKFYVDGIRVASGTTFSVAASVATWYLLAHLEKSTGTETAEMNIDWLRCRTAQQ